jgi:DNA-binding NarL/FixJ family response regulator
MAGVPGVRTQTEAPGLEVALGGGVNILLVDSDPQARRDVEDRLRAIPDIAIEVLSENNTDGARRSFEGNVIAIVIIAASVSGAREFVQYLRQRGNFPRPKPIIGLDDSATKRRMLVDYGCNYAASYTYIASVVLRILQGGI